MNILPICKFFNNSFNFLSESPVFFRNACVFFLFFSILSLKLYFCFMYPFLFRYIFNAFWHSITSWFFYFSVILYKIFSFYQISSVFLHNFTLISIILLLSLIFSSCLFLNQRYSIQNQFWTIFVKLFSQTNSTPFHFIQLYMHTTKYFQKIRKKL